MAALRDLHRAGNQRHYEVGYRVLIRARQAIARLPEGIFADERVCLLCAEAKPDTCHRRIAAELIQDATSEMVVCHL
jgi:hypothetical protein